MFRPKLYPKFIAKGHAREGTYKSWEPILQTKPQHLPTRQGPSMAPHHQANLNSRHISVDPGHSSTSGFVPLCFFSRGPRLVFLC